MTADNVFVLAETGNLEVFSMLRDKSKGKWDNATK